MNVIVMLPNRNPHFPFVGNTYDRNSSSSTNSGDSSDGGVVEDIDVNDEREEERKGGAKDERQSIGKAGKSEAKSDDDERMTTDAADEIANGRSEEPAQAPAAKMPGHVHPNDNDTAGNDASGSKSNDDSNIGPVATAGLSGMDVICGRHRTAFNHLGNRRFRHTVSLNLPSYLENLTRAHRAKLITDIAKNHRARGGRFLKYTKHGTWCDLMDKEVREKIGHALRDAAAVAQGLRLTTPPSSASSLGAEGGTKKRRSTASSQSPSKLQRPYSSSAPSISATASASASKNSFPSPLMLSAATLPRQSPRASTFNERSLYSLLSRMDSPSSSASGNDASSSGVIVRRSYGSCQSYEINPWYYHQAWRYMDDSTIDAIVGLGLASKSKGRGS